MDSIPGQGTKIPHAMWCGQKVIKKPQKLENESCCWLHFGNEETKVKQLDYVHPDMELSWFWNLGVFHPQVCVLNHCVSLHLDKKYEYY